MITHHKYWTIEELRKNFDNIEFPEFQREPTVWKREKKQRLIDSILRDFDISSIYFFKKESGGYDCIDGRQRINAIWSFLGINDSDIDHNNFSLKIENEIYEDSGYFMEVDDKRFESFDKAWREKFLNYKLNIVEITEVGHDEELNLLFLRLQIASVLNAGEKLNAMTGEMREWIFYDLSKNNFFHKIHIPNRRFAKEQVAAQIVLNYFSKKKDGDFHRSRYFDLQDFFKEYSKLQVDDQKLKKEIEGKFDKIEKSFGDNLSIIGNRAIAVSIYLFISDLIDQKKEKEINLFIDFFIKFLKTTKWQIPKGYDMNPEYRDLLKFQSNITQAAGEKTAIQKRHDFLGEYFYYYKKNNSLIKGDEEYQRATGKDPNIEREGGIIKD